jgi:hypothetical protein
MSFIILKKLGNFAEQRKDELHESWVLTTQILTTGLSCDCQMARSRQLLWTRL